MLLIYGIVLLVYFCCPQYMKLVILVANIFLPDAVPAIDEILMVVGLFAGGSN
jgi:hypothetical protein